jgi:PAS domain-containing protein
MNDLEIKKGLQQVRVQLVEVLTETVNASLATLTLEIDEEILTELKERIAALVFSEQVNDSPAVQYLAVWEDGCKEIRHLYMSPNIKELLGYSAEELGSIGYGSIVGADILSFYQDKDNVQEKIIPVSMAQEKRKEGFIGNRNWEGYYKLRKKSGKDIWVIDKAVITKFRNTLNKKVICVSGGLLLETTQVLDGR